MIDFLKLPYVPYEQQIELLNARLAQRRTETGPDGSQVEFTYEKRINAVRGDSTRQGDMPMEYLQSHTRLPVGEQSHVKFTLQSKNEKYLNFESAIYREPAD